MAVRVRGRLDEAERLWREARDFVAQYQIAEAGTRIESATALLDQLEDESLDAAERTRAVRTRLRLHVTSTWLRATNDRAGALSTLAEVESTAWQHGWGDIVGSALQQAAVLHAREGDFVTALSLLRRAGRWLDRLPPDDQVRLLLNRGVLASMLMDLAQASADLAAAASLADEVGLPEMSFMARHNHGYVAFLQGDLPRALGLMGSADAMPVEVDRGVSHQDRARVLLEAGLVDEALASLDLAAASLARPGLEHELEQVQLERARCLLVRGRADRAAELAAQIFDTAHARQAWAVAAQAGLVLLDAALTEPVDTPRADLAAIVEASRLAGDLSVVARVALHEALAALAAGDAAAARQHLERAIPMAQSPHLGTRALYRLVRARIALAAGRTRLVMTQARKVAQDISQVKRGIASLDLRSGITLHAAGMMDLDLTLAAESRRPSRLLMASERWRVATQPVTSVVPDADPEVAAEWSRLRRQREDLREAPPGRGRDELRRDIALSEQRLRQRSWTATRQPAVEEVEVGGIEVISEAVERDQAALVSLIWLEDGIHAIVVRPGQRMRHVRLGLHDAALRLARIARADIDAVASAPAGPLRGAVLGSLEHTLGRLETLILPDLDLGDRVVIVPTGRLSAVPWGMLPRLRGRVVTVARSATSWAAGRLHLETMPVVAAVAGPALSGALPEVDRVVASWPEGTRIASNGNDVREALGYVDILHVAAHGDHRSDSPLFSSVRLDDGPLFAHELEGQALRTSLVVLSACEVGVSEVRLGDEPLGLTACLLDLGVRAVVAPVASVNDEVALSVMEVFHRELRRGTDGEGALAVARAAAGPGAGAFSWFGSSWSAVPVR